MRNIRLTIAYDGTSYSGWQIQPNAPTVQGELEARLEQMTGVPTRLRAAGRTDAGVHAEGQIANFRTENTRISCRGFFRGLNALLPESIAVLDAVEVAPDFDSRRHNHGKHYCYSIWNAEARLPQRTRTTWQIYRPLALAPMAVAARALVGTHDFAAFRSATCDAETTVRTIHCCAVSAAPGEALVQIHVQGSAFLKNMVRIIAGTLVEVGQGRLAADQMETILASRDRQHAGLTAPAHGLCLKEVFFR